MAMNWNTHVLQHILGYIPCCDRTRVRLVSREWNNAEYVPTCSLCDGRYVNKVKSMIKAGHVWCLRNAYKPEYRDNHMICLVACGGNLACLQLSHEIGYWWPWGITACIFAARGQLEGLKYAHENGCPWSSDH